MRKKGRYSLHKYILLSLPLEMKEKPGQDLIFFIQSTQAVWDVWLGRSVCAHIHTCKHMGGLSMDLQSKAQRFWLPYQSLLAPCHKCSVLLLPGALSLPFRVGLLSCLCLCTQAHKIILIFDGLFDGVWLTYCSASYSYVGWKHLLVTYSSTNIKLSFIISW